MSSKGGQRSNAFTWFYGAIRPGARNIVSWLMLLTVFSIFQVAAKETQFTYIGYKELRWKDSADCSETPGNNPSEAGIFYVQNNTGAKRVICESSPFFVSGNVVDIYYQASFSEPAVSRVSVSLTARENKVTGIRIKNATNGWQRLRVILSENAQKQALVVKLYVRTKAAVHAAIRSRADISAISTTELALDSWRNSWGTRAVVAVLVGTVLLFHILAVAARARLSLFATLVLAAICVHFRFDTFFHADEWLYMERFYELGVVNSWLRHNEHFIPVFGLIYYFQLKTFGLWHYGFSLTSCLLLAINAHLISELLGKLFAKGLAKRSLATVSCLYVVSSLHSESVQWSLAQGSLLAITFALVGAIAFIHFARSGASAHASVLFAAVLAAIFSFSIAFVLAVLLLPLPLLCSRKPLKWSRICSGGAIVLLAVFLAGIAYRLSSEGFFYARLEDRTQSWQLLKDFTQLGAHFGTILRGLGLFPFPEMQRFYPLLGNPTPVELHDFRVALADIGALINGLILAMFIAFSRNEQTKLSSGLWLVSQLWIQLPLFVVALGRAHLGEEYAISYRYQEFPLIGLCLLLVPLAQGMVGRKGLGWFRRICGGGIVTLLFAAQVHSALSFRHFTESGSHLKFYISQLLGDRIAGPESDSRSLVSSMRPLLYVPQIDAMQDVAIGTRTAAEIALHN